MIDARPKQRGTRTVSSHSVTWVMSKIMNLVRSHRLKVDMSLTCCLNRL